ncbi:cysteine desulfurase mitochondrial-like [Senna tora]|uniref:Cysteine desulfurase mitochondrial-like n=1 Tax=Senna tora TaxID=362788 RepID=A0A834TQF4_9FABA|nr:cysteine desulfurase mitochondrial-like [Senna tora]
MDTSVIKVKVEFDVRKVIMRGTNIGSKKDGIHWVDFRYERFPQFCYKCGIIGHDNEQCLIDLDGEKEDSNEDLPYGPWIRATQSGKRIKEDSGGGEAYTNMASDKERCSNITKVESEFLMEKLRALTVNETSNPPLCDPNTEQLGETPSLPSTPKVTEMVPVLAPHHSGPVKMICEDVGDETSEVTKLNQSLRTWKRVARLNNENTPPLKPPNPLKRARVVLKEIAVDSNILDSLGSEKQKRTKPTFLERKELAQKKPFRFEHMWTKHEGCAEIIKNIWDGDDPFSREDMGTKLRMTAENLSRWNKETFGNVNSKIRDLQRQINDLTSAVGAPLEELRNLERELNKVLEQEELM